MRVKVLHLPVDVIFLSSRNMFLLHGEQFVELGEVTVTINMN